MALSIDDWFAGRTITPPQGVELANYGKPNRTRSDLRLAAGMGSNAKGKIVVVAMGCERTDHGKRYAELLAPLDTSVVERYSQMASSRGRILTRVSGDAGRDGKAAGVGGPTGGHAPVDRESIIVQGSFPNNWRLSG